MKKTIGILVAIAIFVSVAVTFRKQEFYFVNGLFGNINEGEIFTKPVYHEGYTHHYMQVTPIGKTTVLLPAKRYVPATWQFIVKGNHRFEVWSSADSTNLVVGRKVSCMDYECIGVWE